MDARGYFKYVFQQSGLAEPHEVSQVNHSFSREGVLRGIHLEPWQKLVTVISGRARICVVNLIPSHPEYTDHMLIDTGEDSPQGFAVLIPMGFGNAFLALRDTHYLNFVSKEYSEKGRSGARWDDPVFGVDWALRDEPTLSSQDKNWAPWSSDASVN